MYLEVLPLQLTAGNPSEYLVAGVFLWDLESALKPVLLAQIECILCASFVLKTVATFSKRQLADYPSITLLSKRTRKAPQNFNQSGFMLFKNAGLCVDM